MPKIATISSQIGHGSIVDGVFSGTITGTMTSATGKTKVLNNSICVVGNTANCNFHGGTTVATVLSGSSIADDQGNKMARMGDPLSCGAIIATGLAKFEVA